MMRKTTEGGFLGKGELVLSFLPYVKATLIMSSKYMGFGAGVMCLADSTGIT
jgi:hypothetical protein